MHHSKIAAPQFVMRYMSEVFPPNAPLRGLMVCRFRASSYPRSYAGAETILSRFSMMCPIRDPIQQRLARTKCDVGEHRWRVRISGNRKPVGFAVRMAATRRALEWFAVVSCRGVIDLLRLPRQTRIPRY